MLKQELHEWTSPFVHTADRAAFIFENHQHVAHLLREWERYGPDNRAEAIDQLLGNVHDYRKSTYGFRAATAERRDSLRKVNFIYYGTTDWVTESGWFHRWADTYEEFATGPVPYTMALVEGDDGRPHFVHPEKLQFHVSTPTLP